LADWGASYVLGDRHFRASGSLLITAPEEDTAVRYAPDGRQFEYYLYILGTLRRPEASHHVNRLAGCRHSPARVGQCQTDQTKRFYDIVEVPYEEAHAIPGSVDRYHAADKCVCQQASRYPGSAGRE
jgi:hypothetical protein